MALPRVPIGRERTQDEFWLQQGTSGAINAFRQLTSLRHKAGRKKVSLPGGKLKPLFKNHVASARLPTEMYGARQVLPDIGSSTLEPLSSASYIMTGHFHHLPPEEPNTVRVYLCSNYEDMKMERAILVKRAVPQLQQFCAKQGLHFQLVDFHLGVTGGAHDITSSSQLRLREIQACHKLSLGPAFVMLLGDRLGAPRLPPVLSESVFQVLSSTVASYQIDGEELLQKFYRKDENSIPASFVLQFEGDAIDGLASLHSLLRRAANQALRDEKLTESEYYELTMSVIEEEVNQGVFTLKNPRHHCLFYRREWQHINLTDPHTPTLVDVVQDEGTVQRDAWAQRRLQDLSERVTQHLGPSYCKPYYLHWDKSRRPNPATTYLQLLCDDFVADCQHLIEQGLRRTTAAREGQVSIYPEVLHHCHLEANRALYFQGQEKLLFQVQRYLQDPRCNGKPCVMYGPPGSGKTSTMAHLARQLRVTSAGESVIILRFLGTSAESSSMYSLIVGLTIQICAAYGLQVPAIDVSMNTLYCALRMFRDTLETVSQAKASGKPLYILLDGIEQLQPIDESLWALWAICKLPNHVHMVISTTKELNRLPILKLLQDQVCGEEACHELEPLSEAQAQAMLTAALEANQRCLEEEQKNILMETYQEDPTPLYMKVLINMATHTASFEPMMLEPGETMSQLFMSYLDDLEQKHGELTVRTVVSYITMTGVGIQEKELLDLLAGDAEVMEEVKHFYQNDKGSAAFPPLAWARLRHDLRFLLEDHKAYGRTVVGWNHSVYSALLAERYGVIYSGIDESKITNEGTLATLGLHESLTNLYTHNTNEHVSNVISTWEVPKATENALISPQYTNINNVLKLQRLPVHLYILVPIEGLQRVVQLMFGSLLWLRTKLKAFPIQATLHDIVHVLSLCRRFIQEGVIEHTGLYDELLIIMELLQQAFPALLVDPDFIAVEVLARLPRLAPDHPTISSLVTAAKNWLAELTTPQLVPLYPCLEQPRGTFRFMLDGPTHVIKFLKEKRLAVLFCQGRSVDLWKVDTGELHHRFAVNAEQTLKGVIPMTNERFVVIAHYSHLRHCTELAVWSVETGIQVVASTFEHRFEAIGLDPSDQLLVMATVTEDDADGPQRHLVIIDMITRNTLSTTAMEDAHLQGVSQILFATGVHEAKRGLLTIGAKMSRDVALWDLNTSQMIFHLNTKCFIDHLKVVPERRMAVCASSDSGIVLLVDLKVGTVTSSVSNKDFVDLSSIYVTRESEHVLVATRQTGVAVVSLETGVLTKTVGEAVKVNIRPSSGPPPASLPLPTCITMDPDEHFLVVGCLNGQIKLYAVASGHHVDTLRGHRRAVNCLHFDADRRLYSTSDDRVGRVWHVAGLLERHLSTVDPSVVQSLDGFRQFDEVVGAEAANPEDGEESEEQEEKPQPGEKEEVEHMAVDSQGRWMATASRQNAIKLWNVTDGRLIRVYKDGCSHGASQVYFAYRDQCLVGHCYCPEFDRAHTLRVWRVETGAAVPLGDKPVYVFTSCITSDGCNIFTVSPSKKKSCGIVLGLYDLFDPRLVASLPCNIYGSMDRTNLSLIGCISEHQMATPATDPVPKLPRADSSSATSGRASAMGAIPADGQSLPASPASTPDKGSVTHVVLTYHPEENVSYFFTFIIGEEAISMEHHSPMHIDTASPRCTVLVPFCGAVSGTVDGSLMVWDVAKHAVQASLVDLSLVSMARQARLNHPSSTGCPAHDGPVTDVALSSGAHSLLVSGGMDAMVRVWDVRKQGLLHVLAGHSEPVTQVAISPDGKHATSGSADCTLAVWQVASGSKSGSFYTHQRPTAICMPAASNHLFSVCNGNIIALKMTNV